jgi:hypothetical protein
VSKDPDNPRVGSRAWFLAKRARERAEAAARGPDEPPEGGIREQLLRIRDKPFKGTLLDELIQGDRAARQEVRRQREDNDG